MTNLEAKKEAVKKAYGEFWELVKDLVRTDGSLSEPVWRGSNINLDYDDFSTGYFRPKSLQGIENNNGWIKIESEADLPKEDYYGELFEVGFLDDIGYFHHERKRCSLKSLKWMFDKKIISHYQPIEKPKPPIY